jgi:hypothetical protein
LYVRPATSPPAKSLFASTFRSGSDGTRTRDGVTWPA